MEKSFFFTRQQFNLFRVIDRSIYIRFYNISELFEDGFVFWIEILHFWSMLSSFTLFFKFWILCWYNFCNWDRPYSGINLISNDFIYLNNKVWSYFIFEFFYWKSSYIHKMCFDLHLQVSIFSSCRIFLWNIFRFCFCLLHLVYDFDSYVIVDFFGQSKRYKFTSKTLLFSHFIC